MTRLTCRQHDAERLQNQRIACTPQLDLTPVGVLDAVEQPEAKLPRCEYGSDQSPLPFPVPAQIPYISIGAPVSSGMAEPGIGRIQGRATQHVQTARP